MDKIEDFIRIVNNSKYLVFFGGAGVSTESGIPDFRSKDGLYNQDFGIPAETILSHSFFMNNTADFYNFYFKYLGIDAVPNITHKKLAQLEKKGILKAVITQNIDALHEKAGSINVLNLHGCINNYYCIDCNKEYKLSEITKEGVPHCSCGGILKPDVVLYEETLKNEVVDEAIKHIISADTLIVAGTSLNVFPAANLINFFRGKNLIVINRDKIDVIGADLIINDSLGNVFGKLEL